VYYTHTLKRCQWFFHFTNFQSPVLRGVPHPKPDTWGDNLNPKLNTRLNHDWSGPQIRWPCTSLTYENLQPSPFTWENPLGANPTPLPSPRLPHTENKKKCFFSFVFPHTKEEVCLEEHLFVCTMHTTQ